MGLAEVDAELRQEFEEIARDAGCELLDCRFRAGTLRLVIDRPEGVSLADCQSISKQISALLDVADFGTGRYLLEVSSPGLDRELYGERDYERFQGRLVRVTWRDESMANKRTVVGRLDAYSPVTRAIEVTTRERQDRLVIPLQDIQIARLEPEF